MNDFLIGSRFASVELFPSKSTAFSPTMHGGERKWIDDAILTNWFSTVGANISAMEVEIVKYAVSLMLEWPPFTLQPNLQEKVLM